MTHIWNIYETGDPLEPGPDPFDVFVYMIRKDEEPHVNDVLFVEGECRRIFTIERDHRKEEAVGMPDERYWKVCAR